MLKFELSEDMVKAIGMIVEQAPYKVAAPILQEMQKQITEQETVSQQKEPE